MFKKLLLLMAFIGLTTSMMAQTLRGTVTDDLGDPLPFVNVLVKTAGTTVRGTTTDLDGNYIITPLDPSTYDIEYSYIGYATITLQKVVISNGVVTEKNAQMQEASALIAEIVLTDEKSLIEKDNTGGQTVTREEFADLPVRSATAIAANTAGVTQKDADGDINVRGGRDEQTVYYVDGVKMVGGANLPTVAMGQIQVITGGLPAEYGDATSGVISITTRAPSPVKAASFDIQTSELLDDYGYTLGEFVYTGPLAWTKTETDTSVLAGLFLSGNIRHLKDNTYSINSFELNSDAQNAISLNPLTMGGSPESPFGVNSVHHVIAETDLKELDYRRNNENDFFNLQSKINIKTGENSSLKIGGTFRNGVSGGPNYRNSVFNSGQSGERVDNRYTIYANFVQYFKDEKKEDGTSSAISNANYNIRSDFQSIDSDWGDSRFGEDYGKYGYVGKFTPVYRKDGATFLENFGDIRNVTFMNNITGEEETVTITAFDQPAVWRDAFGIDHWEFDAGSLNKDKAAYTSQYFDFANDFGQSALNQISAGGGLLNGGQPTRIYGLFEPQGSNYDFAQKFKSEQFRLTGAASAMIKDHQIKIGFEFEKRTERSWAITPNSLWTVGRLLSNSYIDAGSIKRYEFNGNVNDDGQLILDEFTDLSGVEVTGFAKNARDLLGLGYEDFLNVHGMDPNDLDINLFSTEELLNQEIIANNGTGNYYGYNPHGSEVTSKVSMDNFLNDSLSNGSLKREVGAFEPIYMAGYIQDKFFVRDLVFNVGVRIDRYDANQEILNDPYSIYDAVTAGELITSDLDVLVPSNIGDNFVVYVDNAESPNKVNGYRNGNTWYDADGAVISDVSKIYGDGRAQPMLTADAKDGLSKNNGLNTNAFGDYDPEITVMPRVSFNFPISDVAMFYAFYDIKTIRPLASASRFDPINYLDIALGEQGVIAKNPNLKPEKSTDYEMGFKQVLGENATIDLSAFYREQRDMVQLLNVTDAYPATYMTRGNVDFGTVKGASISFAMKRVGNVRFNANYTLQFAEGSGSSATSGFSLANSGQPNLRTTLPLSFDSRHQIQSTIDYKMFGGKAYNGPENRTLKAIFENTSSVLSFTAQSGNPYSKILSPVDAGGNDRTTLDGTPNGARLPWTYRLDLKVQKNFNVKMGKKDAKGNRKAYSASVYLQVNNLLDTRNVNRVYQYTGNATDDGYLDSAAGQQAASEQENEAAYRSLYALYIQNHPNNYLRPRTIRLGLTMNFQ